VIIAAIPPGCEWALDVGCGTGSLTRRLKRLVPQVTGIDRDARSIEVARAHPDAADIGYLLEDFFSAPLEPGSFDLITSIASLHHMDAAAALRRMPELLRPGGVLAVVGLARDSWPAGLCAAVPAVIGNRLHRATAAIRSRAAGGPASAYHPPIVWPPPLSYREMRRLAVHLMPGVRYRRHLYWRYSLVWTKPP
jgi:SAM-dependent methyltransferase